MSNNKILIELIKSPVLSALIGALTATLLSPFIKWRIEIKRIKLNNRKELIQKTRETFSNSNFVTIVKFRYSDNYHKICIHFSSDLRKNIEKLIDKLVKNKNLFAQAYPSFISLDESFTEDEKKMALKMVETSEADAKNELNILKGELNVLKDNIFEELAKIEKKWKLI
jgi:hypothetical protein